MGVLITLAGRVAVDGRGLSRQAGLALAYLVCERHRPVPRDELAEVLWPGELPRSWETLLRGLASVVRRELSAATSVPPTRVLTSRLGCYQVHLPAGARLDVEAAAAEVGSARAALADGRPDQAVAAAGRAAATAARRFLPGAAGAWVERRQAELRDVHVRALEALAEGAAATGDWPGALRAAEEAVALEPFRESAHVLLMAAHRGAGNHAEALRAYERCRRHLAEELGVDPSPATEAAYLALLGEEPAPAPAPRPGPPAPAPSNLPLQLTSFVGRGPAIANVGTLLDAHRLVSLVGTGGMGKSRLALEVAAGRLAQHPDGVFLVELAPLTDPGLLGQQVASALGLREESGRSLVETLLAHLAPRHVLVVLDNCEHVVAGSAELVERLLRGCPHLRVLAATREPLGVPGEVTWRVPALSVPGEDPATTAGADHLAGFESVRLFADRAAAARPGFALTAANAAAVGQICRRLDGIPLAIELAAARVAALTPEEVASRLDDRFRLLAGGSRTLPPRHQTLRAAVDWTYGALTPAERELFARLSVFAGGFTLEAAEEVCGDGAGEGAVPRRLVLELVLGLVHKSLVIGEASGGATRYRLLETLREYARERLVAAGADAARRGRHLAWLAALAERAEPELRGPDQVRLLDVLEAEHENVRAALRGGGEGAGGEDGEGGDATLRLVAALGRFWEVRGYLSEGRGWLEEALDAGGGAAGIRAKALNWAGVLAQRQGDYEVARARLGESLALRREAGDDLGVAAALHGLGNLAALQGDLATARRLYEECLALGRSLGADEVVAASLTNLGWVAQSRGDLAAARPLYEQSLAARRVLQDKSGIAMVLGNLGFLAFQQGDHDTARALGEESLGLQRELGDRAGVADSLNTLGHLALEGGALGEARSLLEESLALRRELGDRPGLPGALRDLAEVARAEGDREAAEALLAESLVVADELGDRLFVADALGRLGRLALAGDDADRAACLLGAADALRRWAGRPPPRPPAGRDDDLAALRRRLGPDRLREWWDRGGRMSLEEVVRYAGVRPGTAGR